MSVKGVIFDVSGTMLNGAKPVPGIIEAVDRLRGLGVLVIAVNNNGPSPVAHRQLLRAGITVDHVATYQEVGRKKGSPVWIDYIKQLTGLQTHELVYVGDSDHDMYTASHSRVVYFHAAWTQQPSAYGIQAPSPGWVAAAVIYIFRKQHLWGWTLRRDTDRGVPFRQLALVDSNLDGEEDLKGDLITMLKDRGDSLVGQMRLRDFVMLHLVASIYAEKLQDTTDIWCTVPSRDGQRHSSFAQSLDVVAKLFRDRYLDGCLERHTAAIHSKDARARGGFAGAIDNQLSTLVVNANHRPRLAGRNVLLIDDFLTWGITVGVGRLLLRVGGAPDVVTVAVGKYGPRVQLLGRPQPDTWDVTRPAPISSADVPFFEAHGTYHPEALAEFLSSYRAMQGERW